MQKFLGYRRDDSAAIDPATGAQFRPLPQRPDRSEATRERTVSAPEVRSTSRTFEPNPGGQSMPPRTASAFSSAGYFDDHELRPLPKRPGSVVAAREAQKEVSTNCLSTRKLVTCGLILGIGAALVLLLMPREPTWQVLDLNFGEMYIPAITGLEQGSLEGIVRSFTGNHSAVKMSVMVTVRATNPNVVGAEALPGQFNIMYMNNTIGKAVTKEQGIGPWSSVDMTINVTVDGVPGNLGLKMVRHMQNNHMLLPIECEGNVIAKVGSMKVLSVIRCDVVTDVSVLPTMKFAKKVCTYTYGLPTKKQLRITDKLLSAQED